MGNAERFWLKVTRLGPDECWPWNAAKNTAGYGVVWWDGGCERAHRVAFFLTHGRWPQCGLHRCDNRPCCNPAHLFDGSRTDNAIDMYRKGRDRQERGEQRYNAKLTESDVLIIRSIRGLSPRAIGERFGVSRGTVRAILKGKRWRHVLPSQNG